ncbi:zinc finger protein [Striga asiatica]|uniref:Zinc finger protein n=1 Tax=Striga asiatica TaxID=4170 RepID=A0A5A7NWM5_STRAF|nr:zinc finger protein [Striga asiatica]
MRRTGIKCRKAFAPADNLSRHWGQIKDHREIKEKQIRCFCGKFFKTLNGKKLHMKHCLHVAPSPPSQFSCMYLPRMHLQDREDDNINDQLKTVVLAYCFHNMIFL